jgi:hypothetical protein
MELFFRVFIFYLIWDKFFYTRNQTARRFDIKAFMADEGNLVQKMKKNGDTWKCEYDGNGMMSKVIRPDNILELHSSMIH